MFTNIQINQQEAIEIADTWKYPVRMIFMTWLLIKKTMTKLLTKYKEKSLIFPKDESMAIGVELGIGMKPELTGIGLGKDFIELIINCLIKNYSSSITWLSVAEFNKRAIKVYQRTDFRQKYKIKQCSNGREDIFVVMSNT